jgi:hypothetical protein
MYEAPLNNDLPLSSGKQSSKKTIISTHTLDKEVEATAAVLTKMRDQPNKHLSNMSSQV